MMRWKLSRKTALKNQMSASTGDPEKDSLIKNKAAFYRGTISGRTGSKVYDGLGAIPAGLADLGSGSALLPSVLSMI